MQIFAVFVVQTAIKIAYYAYILRHSLKISQDITVSRQLYTVQFCAISSDSLKTHCS